MQKSPANSKVICCVRSTITVFRQRRPDQKDLRIWNFFTVAYAGYNTESDPNNNEADPNPKRGDQSNLAFTKVIISSAILGGCT